MTNNSLERAIVLVVDDHPDTLQLLMDALEDAGVTVLIATDGQHALEQITHLLPDLILLDAMMPGMDGFATCRALKSGIGADVPVIFMTGLDETEHVVKGLEAGGIDYLTKPIAPDELLARMRVHLAHAREAQGVRAALDVSGRTMLAADGRGVLKWATPQARQILLKLSTSGQSASPTAIELPQQVCAWIARRTTAFNDSIVVATHDLKIRFRLLSHLTEEEILLVMQEAEPLEIERASISKLESRFGLTSREAEVLYWLSNGKANRDIADILGISYRTVDKHLEHLFTKIGVESRVSAVAATMRLLNE